MLPDIIVTTARCHRLPVTPELFAMCEWELDRCASDDKAEIVEALYRAFQSYQTTVVMTAALPIDGDAHGRITPRPA